MMAGPIHVRLREVGIPDLPALYAMQADPDSAAMAGVPSRDHAAFLEHRAQVAADPEVVWLVIDVDGEVAGNVLCFIQHGRRVVGYWLVREHWGRGIATAALRELLEVVGERPLYATVSTSNAGSRRVLAKCGFVQAGEPEVVDGVEQILLELP